MKRKLFDFGPTNVALLAVGISLAAATPTWAKEKVISQSELADELITCLSISDSGERLVCYDREVGRFKTAKADGSLVIAKREDIEKARQESFGLSYNNNPLFVDEQGNRLTEISSAITKSYSGSDGKLVFELANGSTWRQVDTIRLRRLVKSDSVIEIRSAALGSFLANVDGQNAIRVKRVN